MKRDLNRRTAGMLCRCAATLAIGSASLALAQLPVPSFVYYGEVSDAFGWPFTALSGAQAVARVGGRECGRSVIHEERGPAINYRVEVPVYDGRGGFQPGFAARPGDRVTFTVEQGGVAWPAMDPEAVPPVGQPGGIARHNLCTGTDTDADGLPDEWENWIASWSGGTLTNIAQVRGADDFDGDGASNRDEFLAGTDPTWDVDALRIERIVPFPASNRVGIAFFSVPGKTYWVMGAPSLPGSLVPSALALAPAAAAQDDYWRGDGYHSWLYVDAPTNNAPLFLRLRVE